MSDPGQPRPDQPEPPAKKSSGLDTVAKLVLVLLALAVGLIVLVFGTCLLMFSR